MIKNTILSMIIGTLATYLPFWQWDGTVEQVLGAVVVGIITMTILTALEKAPRVGARKGA